MKSFIMNKSTEGIFLNYQRKIKILLYRKLLVKIIVDVLICDITKKEILYNK